MGSRADALVVLLIGLALALPATALPSRAAPAHETPKTYAKKKHHVRRIPPGVGFLPGYRTPAQIERDRRKEYEHDRRAYFRNGGAPIYYYSWGYPNPRFYRGRWNGGSFGPCWTVTPIGYQWNCGR